MNRLSHRRLQKQVHAYIDDELDDADVVKIEAHLDECPDCDALTRLLFRTKKSMQALADRRPDDDTLGRLMTRAQGLISAGPDAPEQRD